MSGIRGSGHTADNLTIRNFWIERLQEYNEAVYITSSKVVFDRLYVRDNKWAQGTALRIDGQSSVDIGNSEITNNNSLIAETSGGFVIDGGSSVTISNGSKLYQNSASGNQYEGWLNDGTLTISGSTIRGLRNGIYPLTNTSTQTVNWGSGNLNY